MNTKNFLLIIISILILTDIAMLLDITGLRQILGFLFLTILPGLLILRILKLNKLFFLEKFILTWGLSISFLMLFGLLINSLSLSIGYERPIATIPLLISFNIAFIVLAIIGYKINLINTEELHPSALFDFSPKKYLSNLNLATSEKAFLIVPIWFPALSIFGMRVMNTTDNNVILMFLLLLIPTYVVFVCFFNHKFPKRLYPVVIFLISISLLLLISLRSNHLIGFDVHEEYHFFRATFNNAHWSVLDQSVLNACLSISILPAIYQSFLNVNKEYFFKILYVLLFSITPIIIFIISRKYVGEVYAFLAAFFFMAQRMFLWTAYSPRTNTAVLFIALAILILFTDEIDALKRKMLFIVFMVSVIVSHYSSACIFFFIMLFCWLSFEILSKRFTFKKSIFIGLTMVLLFFAIIFFWYSQITVGTFVCITDFMENTFRHMSEFFISESRCDRTQTIVTGKDIIYGENIKEFVYKIEFVFTWFTFALIGVGVISILKRYKEMVAIPETEVTHLKPDFLKTKFPIDYFSLVMACTGLIAILVFFPYVSKGYDLQRLYTLLMIVLSVVFVLGGIILAKLFFFLQKTLLLRKSMYGKFASHKTGAKRKNNRVYGKVFHSNERVESKNGSEVLAYLIILLVLIPYFMCVTGTMYVLFGVPREITLSSEGMQYDVLYIHDHERIATGWRANSEVLEGRLVNKQKTIDMMEYLDLLDERNRIYNNGGSEVWG